MEGLLFLGSLFAYMFLTHWSDVIENRKKDEKLKIRQEAKEKRNGN